MNWKDVPHLFANGKFGFRYKDYNEFGAQIDIIAEPDFFEMGIIISDAELNVDVRDCTLIARPISDMTDEELVEFENFNQPDMHFRYSKNHMLFMPHPESFLYLLTIGVYPFDQSHFETGEVIARRNNE